MPASPTPIYVVTYGSSNFPGYVQQEEQPLNIRTVEQGIYNRNGGIASPSGAELMQIALDFIVLSQLDNVTELEHLNNCKDQYATARKIVARATAMAALYIGGTTKHVNAIPVSISAPLIAGSSRQIKYSVRFLTEPYWIGDTAVTGSFSGNTTVNLSFTDDTLDTYPIFAVPSGVTAFTASHAASGKTIAFVRDTVTGALTIDCADFSVTKDSGGLDASITMTNVNFGMRHSSGAGTMAIVVTGYAGSGTVNVSAYPRFAL